MCCVVAVTFSSCGRKSYVNVGGLKWAAKNVGATEDNPYGDLYTYDQALKACPDGWRLPTSDELERLCLQYSKPVSYDGMNGVWLSGSTPYKDALMPSFSLWQVVVRAMARKMLIPADSIGHPRRSTTK